MTSPTPVSGDRLLRDPQDFSLVLGGPLFQLLRRAHLSDDALMLMRQRILVLSLFAWLPLLVLSALEGQVIGGRAAVPFLLDVDVHIRFLVALPLLIVAELVVHQRMRFVVKQFLERQLIPESARTRFDAAIASALRLRNSVLAEVLLIAFVYGVGVLIVWRQYMALAGGHVVCDTGRRGLDALARGDVVWLCERAALPVPAGPLVFSAGDLGPPPLAGVPH